MDRNDNAHPSAISLFSGAGGLDVGFERAGYQILWANEHDHDAAETWKANRPNTADVMHEGDICEQLDDLAALRGKADVVIGGPPCQGFSVAGKMNPDDPRSELIWKFLDVIALVQPKVFLIENVKALAELEKFRGVREGIVARGRELGYDVSYAVYLASDYGVPENRERVLFFGVRETVGESRLAHEAMRGLVSKPRSLRETLLGAGAYASAENPQTCSSHVTLAKNPVMRKSPYAGMLVNGAGRPIDLDEYAPTLPASMGGNKTPIIDQAVLDDPSRENWFSCYHRKLAAGATTPADEEVPGHVRRLTLAEAAAIQTFPPGYVFVGKKTKRYRQVGNAVPCNLAFAAARAIEIAYPTFL